MLFALFTNKEQTILEETLHKCKYKVHRIYIYVFMHMHTIKSQYYNFNNFKLEIIK